jgi:hypothetical protein
MSAIAMFGRLVPLATARRSRPAGGHFHLLAQMNVTKANGLNTIGVFEMAAELGC